jgi:hypothetical protein
MSAVQLLDLDYLLMQVNPEKRARIPGYLLVGFDFSTSSAQLQSLKTTELQFDIRATSKAGERGTQDHIAGREDGHVSTQALPIIMMQTLPPAPLTVVLWWASADVTPDDLATQPTLTRSKINHV